MRSPFSFSTAQYRWLAILWTGGILVAFSLPPSSLSSVEPALSYDKAAHFGLFGVFGGLWMRALCPPNGVDLNRRLPRYAVRIMAFGGLFAVASEAYQWLLPTGRMAEPYDVLADVLGLTTGILAYVFYASHWCSSDGSARVHEAKRNMPEEAG